MSSAIQPVSIRPTIQIVLTNAGKDVRSRLALFDQWQATNGLTWNEPRLVEYRDYLLERGLSASSVNSHLSTIRGRYDAILQSDDGRDALYANVPAGATLADAKAYVDEMIGRVYSALNPKLTHAKAIQVQDKADSEQGIRLSREQANALLRAPDLAMKAGLRDLAVIALALCTGLREMELSGLNVEDLRQHLDGELAIRVLEGKGKKQRLVPYGELSWCLAIVGSWLSVAGIIEGAVFRSFYKGGKVSVRRITERAIETIVKAYPVMIDGQLIALAPHDLRRTYAARLYDSGMGILEIQRNLGHADHKTTERYIGAGDSSRRAPQSVYSFDLSSLRWQLWLD